MITSAPGPTSVPLRLPVLATVLLVMIFEGTAMSYPPVHLLDPTGKPLSGTPTSLQVSRAAARSYALQQAVAGPSARDRTPRPGRTGSDIP